MPTPTTPNRTSESRRARLGRGAMFHNLTEVDPEARTAVCTQCGPSRIRKHGTGWRCLRQTIEYNEGWRERNRDLHLQHKHDSHMRNKATRHRYRISTYGLTVDQYDEMAIAQSGLCAICSDQLLDPHIDHDHTTGLVRGLLCSSCNTGIGMLKDDPARLRAALAYLEGA